MPHTREEVLALASTLYGESSLNNIMTTLDEYGIESYEREVNRVQMAILNLSNGSIDKLLYLIKTAKTDYRDILAWQELGSLPEEEGAKWQAMAKDLINKWGKK